MKGNKTCFCFVLIIYFAVFGMVFMPISSGQEEPIASVRIKQPESGATVDGYRIIVKGASTGLRDPNLHLYLLVHPLATPFWWVQPLPTVDRDGNWVTRVYLGKPDVGNNEDYAIKAIITTQKLYEANTFKVNELPSFIVEDQIIVTRKDKYKITPLLPLVLAAIGIIITIIFGVLGIKEWRRKK